LNHKFGEGQEDAMRLLPFVASVLLFATALTSPAFAAKGPTGEVRLRPQDPRLEKVLKDGAARSTTFKALVDRIEASNVIVYIALNPIMKSNLSGMLTWMTQSGGYRYLRASISTELTPEQMIATVAHELQHAVEVIEDESVVDEKTLVALYRRIGHQNSNVAPARWETTAAQQAGFRVRRELGSPPAASTIAGASISQML
jgi:hypothetical protein